MPTARDQFIVWLDFPKVLQGLGDEIAEKFLADMEVKVMKNRTIEHKYKALGMNRSIKQ
jgi:hypothetical protein